MRRTLTAALLLCVALAAAAKRVSINADNEAAPQVFRAIMEQTGKNFVYSSELLKDLKVTIHAERQTLRAVLDSMFAGTDIEYSIKGRNVVLTLRKPTAPQQRQPSATPEIFTATSSPDATELEELIVVSRLEAPAVATAEIGAGKITATEVLRTPALLGEPDVIKALHTQPGVSEGAEGMAGMHVHGGGADENLYMLDNVPLYHVNHFAGLFSAFNPDIIRYIDFFKTSVPAKYDGRLSSFMDVRLSNGNHDEHHGSARLGLTSGSFNISGPIGSRTSYLVGLRRSWFDVLSIPIVAIINSADSERLRFHYYFMDLNARVTHRFSNRISGFASVYFGDDRLKTGFKDDTDTGADYGWADDELYTFHWGNLVVQGGMNYRMSSKLTGEFTAAYTRYFSSLKHSYESTQYTHTESIVTSDLMRTDNNINDIIMRADLDWQAREDSRVRFGASFTHHNFLPARTRREITSEDDRLVTRDSTQHYRAEEVNLYIEDDWKINDHLRVNAGLHASLFEIGGRLKHGISPRLSLAWKSNSGFAAKAAYTRTTQYVHQLTQSYLSLPTDQWIPVTGKFKAQSADKIGAGIYWSSPRDEYSVSVEGYMKWMHNLVEYADEYYLRPPSETWDARLAEGKGSAKGLDFKLSRNFGRLTGHIAYSLAWADRTFKDKNGGRTYPAKFDNRHTIKLMLNWKISKKVELNAFWTGHSGSRFTLMTQMWETPGFDNSFGITSEAPLRAPLNSYRLPFYHRLDLGCTVKNSRGYWTFGLYNAYNHLNTIAIRRTYKDIIMVSPDGITQISKPVFQKVRLLPIIPSISYTWEF